MLGERMGMYDSQEKIEKRLWQNPREGRLAGSAREVLIPPATVVPFEDIEGMEWSVLVKDLSESEVRLLLEEKPVRMLGIVSDDGTGEFLPCAVFPLRAPNEHSLEDLKQERQEFMHKVARVKDMARAGRGDDNPCLKLPMIHK
jgi:hypothetical protein